MNTKNIKIPTTCPSCKSTRIHSCLKAPDRMFARTKLYSLMRCQSCSLAWVLDPPPIDEMTDHYGPQYDTEVTTAGDSAHWLKPRETIMKFKSSGSILDLGCSSGSFLGSLKSDSWLLHGIEFSAVAAKTAIDRTGAQVFVGDVLAAPFPAETFDLITGFHILEHMSSPWDVMAKLTDWMKPDGIIYLRVPNILSGEARMLGSYWYALELPRHLYHFSAASLTHIGESVGLEVRHLSTIRVPFIEQSLRYMWDDVLRHAGITRSPVAAAPPPHLLWRIIRKILRLTIYPMLDGAMSLVGGGQVIEIVFSKRHADNRA